MFAQELIGIRPIIPYIHVIDIVNIYTSWKKSDKEMHEKSANIRNHSFNIAEFYTINEQRECAHDNDNVPAF